MIKKLIGIIVAVAVIVIVVIAAIRRDNFQKRTGRLFWAAVRLHIRHRSHESFSLIVQYSKLFCV